MSELADRREAEKVKKGVILFLLALSVLMIRSEYGDLPASLYGIFMGWTLGRAD